MVGLGLHCFVITLLLQAVEPLTPRRRPQTSSPPSKTSLPVAFAPPTSTTETTPKHATHSISGSINSSSTSSAPTLPPRQDKEAHEYRWLTWLYQHWKDVPYGKLDPDIVKQILPALAAYARRETSQSAQQADDLLDRFIQEYLAGNRVVPLENTAFHSVMHAYAKCAQPEKAQAVLLKMKDLSQSEPDCFGHLQPDVFSFTILTTAWAKSRHPQAADKAERLLRHMEQKGMHVTTLTYNVILNAIAVSHDPTKATRAAKIVRKMQKLVARGHHDHCQPDLYTYQTWIHACSRTRGGVPQTMEILKYLNEQAAAGNKTLRPNAYCFAAAIHSWAYSNEPQKANRAYELLQDMRQRYEIYGQKSCRPNVVVFTSVINACVRPVTYKDKEVAFEIAQLVFEELVYSPYGSPNFLTYAAFLHVCGTSIDDDQERDKVIRRIFGLCQQYGCVGKIVLQKLEETASKELFEDLMGPYESWDDIPRSWKRRVKGERFKSQSEQQRKASDNAAHTDQLRSSISKSISMARPKAPETLRRSFSNLPENGWKI